MVSFLKLEGPSVWVGISTYNKCLVAVIQHPHPTLHLALIQTVTQHAQVQTLLRCLADTEGEAELELKHLSAGRQHIPHIAHADNLAVTGSHHLDNILQFDLGSGLLSLETRGQVRPHDALAAVHHNVGQTGLEAVEGDAVVSLH